MAGTVMWAKGYGRHPKADYHWWVVVEEPGVLPFED